MDEFDRDYVRLPREAMDVMRDALRRHPEPEGGETKMTTPLHGDPEDEGEYVRVNPALMDVLQQNAQDQDEGNDANGDK